MIYNVLAAKLYGINYEFKIGAVIKAILGKILKTIDLLILCPNSKSLYDYLVKLDIIPEKQLMIDLISLWSDMRLLKLNRSMDIITKLIL